MLFQIHLPTHAESLFNIPMAISYTVSYLCEQSENRIGWQIIHVYVQQFSLYNTSIIAIVCIYNTLCTCIWVTCCFKIISQHTAAGGFSSLLVAWKYRQIIVTWHKQELFAKYLYYNALPASSWIWKFIMEYKLTLSFLKCLHLHLPLLLLLSLLHSPEPPSLLTYSVLNM